MVKHCRRCGDELPDNRTNQRYCPHCADVAEFERRAEWLQRAWKRTRAIVKAQEIERSRDEEWAAMGGA